jgi:hypothetical protein
MQKWMPCARARGLERWQQQATLHRVLGLVGGGDHVAGVAAAAEFEQSRHAIVGAEQHAVQVRGELRVALHRLLDRGVVADEEGARTGECAHRPRCAHARIQRVGVRERLGCEEQAGVDGAHLSGAGGRVATGYRRAAHRAAVAQRERVGDGWTLAARQGDTPPPADRKLQHAWCADTLQRPHPNGR